MAKGTSPRVVRLRAPRPFLVRGSKRKVRAAILTFRLPRRAVVVFEVHRIAPTCAGIGTFRVRGQAGKNRVRFPGRVRGRLLRPGTYQLRARGFPGIRVRIAILPKGSTARDARAALRARSVCPAVQAAALVSTASTGEPSAGGGTATGGESQTGGVAAAETPEATEPLGSAEEGRPSAGGALGAIERGARDAGALGLSLILVGILAAILLLGTASLPQTAARGPRLAALVADRRLELALAGVVTLVVVTLAYLVSVQ